MVAFLPFDFLIFFSIRGSVAPADHARSASSLSFPTSVRVQMRTEISALHQRLKTAMIYVTHDLVRAMTMTDKIAVPRAELDKCLAPPPHLAA